MYDLDLDRILAVHKKEWLNFYYEHFHNLRVSVCIIFALFYSEIALLIISR